MKLTAAQWQRAKQLFEQGLDIEPSRRPDWLGQVAGDDADVRREVESLLASADTRSGIFSGPVRTTAAETPESPAPLASGTQVGPWRVRELIGRGGMGEVYRAERSDGAYQQRVALKLLSREAAPQRDRFLQETQMLARLAHPNVARLIDAGTTADLRPYLVMEYVEGQAITDWCNRRQSSISEILELLCKVCDAVDAAHRHFIVHRDIKPSNVLVTAEGEVKLLDFGIAKTLDTGGNGELTLQVGVACTPQYAAPEQLLGEPVTVATDIYSLGVLAYLLLTRRLPRQYSSLMLAAAAAANGDTEATTRPSQAAREQAAQAAKRTDFRQWAKRLEGDIDWIVLKCLQHDPARRYRSASELADDVRRHLRNEPVLARPDSLGYRLGRLVRRNRLATAAAGLAAASLVAGVAGITWEAYQARAQAQRATAVKDFLLDIFRKNSLDNPEGAKARSTTAEQLLAMGAQQIRTHLQDVPETRAEMLGTLGQLYSDLEMSSPAITLFEEQVQTLQRLHGTQATAALAQAEVDLANAFTEGGRTNDSDAALNEALRLLDSIGDRHSLTRAKAYSSLGYNAYQTRPASDPTADRDYEQALQIVRTDYPTDPYRFHVELGLAYVAEDAEHWDLAESQYRQTLAFAKTLEAGGDHISAAKSYDRLGKYLTRRVKYREAEQDLRIAVSMFTEIAGAGNAQTARAQSDLADLLARSGHPAEAEKLFEQVLQETEQSEGTVNSTKVISIKLSLGLLQFSRGKFETSATYFQEAIDSPLHQGVAENYRTVALGHQVELLTAEGRLQEAGQSLDRLTPLMIKVFGEKSSSLANLQLAQAEFQLASGDAKDADAVFRAARKVEETALPGAPWKNSRAGLDLLRAEVAEGKAGDAVALGRTLLAGLQAQADANELIGYEAPIQLWLGTALRSAGKPADALPHLQRAVVLREQLDDAQSPWLAQSRVALADCLIDLRQPAAARPLLDAAAAAVASHPQLASSFTQPLAEARKRLQTT